jgi:hypothetical protein
MRTQAVPDTYARSGGEAMSMPTMPKVLYAQMWRRRDLKDAEWHPLHPTAYYDNVPSMRPEPHEPERADERYEIRVVRYVLDETEGRP